MRAPGGGPGLASSRKAGSTSLYKRPYVLPMRALAAGSRILRVIEVATSASSLVSSWRGVCPRVTLVVAFLIASAGARWVLAAEAAEADEGTGTISKGSVSELPWTGSMLPGSRRPMPISTGSPRTPRSGNRSGAVAVSCTDKARCRGPAPRRERRRRAAKVTPKIQITAVIPSAVTSGAAVAFEWSDSGAPCFDWSGDLRCTVIAAALPGK